MKLFKKLFSLSIFATLLSACAVHQKDYAAFRAHMPKSILVIPPLNETTSLNAEYKFLPTITKTIGEKGYYVFPVALVEQIFKENGVVSPIEMRQIPRDKLREIFGADALLDIKITSWGTKYLILSSYTEVAFQYELIDLGSGITLWTEYVSLTDQDNNSYSNNRNVIGGLIGSLAHAISSSIYEAEPSLARQANEAVLSGEQGLLNGPRWKLIEE